MEVTALVAPGIYILIIMAGSLILAHLAEQRFLQMEKLTLVMRIALPTFTVVIRLVTLAEAPPLIIQKYQIFLVLRFEMGLIAGQVQI
jgi:hypothetical protein